MREAFLGLAIVLGVFGFIQFFTGVSSEDLIFMLSGAVTLFSSAAWFYVSEMYQQNERDIKHLTWEIRQLREQMEKLSKSSPE